MLSTISSLSWETLLSELKSTRYISYHWLLLTIIENGGKIFFMKSVAFGSLLLPILVYLWEKIDFYTPAIAL